MTNTSIPSQPMMALKIKLNSHAQFLLAWSYFYQLGYHWLGNCPKPRTAPYLYTHEDGRILADYFDVEDADLSSPNSANGYFNGHKNHEITLDELKEKAFNPKTLKVGQKVKLDKSWWKVRAVRHPFIICTQNMFGKGYYTIIDIDKNIRGEGTSWGLGHDTDQQIAESMLALHGEHPNEIEQEISQRNNCPVNITAIKDSV